MSETLVERSSTLVLSGAGNAAKHNVLVEAAPEVVVIQAGTGDTTLVSSPLGPRGAQGDQGIQGPPGLDGEADIDDALINGGNF